MDPGFLVRWGTMQGLKGPSEARSDEGGETRGPIAVASIVRDVV